MAISFTMKSGGVGRLLQSGVWSFDGGVPPAESGRAVSLAGWGDRAGLARSSPGAPDADTPQMWLCGEAGGLPPVFHRLSLPAAAPSRPIQRRGRRAGFVYEDAHAQYALLTGILPADAALAPERQAASVFEELEAALNDAGMDFSNVARTWLYMDRILEWYDAFNRARDAFFRSRNVYDGLVPASTGIGSANLSGTAITACAIAVKPRRPGAVALRAVDSPLQCAAQAYGSSFSRAVELADPDRRLLFVSGTAAIEPGGATACIGDPAGQIGMTLDVVEAILRSRGMEWKNASRGVIYLKRPEFAVLWRAAAEKRGLAGLPILEVCADVCRDDLLAELELDAAQPASS